jgi:O-antigen/teichoic acid export membrane protein
VRLAGSFLLCSYRPRPAWDRAILNALLSYGFGHAASNWVWSLRALVNPLIVGRYLGAEAVGVIALTLRLVESLPVFKGTIWRISIAAMGKFQRDSQRVSAAVQEGMRLQVFSVGMPLCGFAVVGPMIIPTDSAWHPILLIFPYIAVGTLVNSTLSSLSAALYVLGRNWDVAAFYLAHVIVFAATATVLVPRIGLSGYGVAEVAALPTYVLLHRSFGRQLGVSAYGTVTFWSLGFALTLFTPLLGPWALLGIFVIMLAPVTWHFVANQFAALWSVGKERGG